MFEKRLKIFLLTLSAVVGLLLVRALQLQVVQAEQWRLEASRTLEHGFHLQTTRGAILDRNGNVLAKDRACMDACVDYRALLPEAEPVWLKAVSLDRLKTRLGDVWSHTPKAARNKMLVDEQNAVQTLINEMWQRLSDISGAPLDAIDETRQEVRRRVELRKKAIWYAAFMQAQSENKPKETEARWKRFLTGESDDAPEIDKYAVTVGEEQQPHVILHDIPTDVQNQLARHPELFPGLKLMPGLRRAYPYDDVAAHVLGHLGKVRQEDLADDVDRLDETRRYLPTDDIGRAGLEWLCEPALRGTLGTVQTRSDDPSQNSVIGAIPGQDVRTSIDVNIQSDIQNFFASATLHVVDSNNLPRTLTNQTLHGAAVLLDVKTNQVMALVSYPTYDANKYNEIYEKLARNQLEQALRNRATESQLEPGSTVKPMVGLSAITQGVVGINEGIECTGYLRLPDSHGKMMTLRNGRCWVASGYEGKIPSVAHHPIPYGAPHKGHDGNPDGFLTYSDGLERSCNVYFETVADRLGIDSLTMWMRRFGLGHRTGIGIEEFSGRVPADAPPNFGMRRRTTGFLAGIGQGYVAATPIQMANIASTIARGGIWMRPHLVLPDKITGKMPPLRTDEADNGPDQIDLHLDPAALEACRKGMLNVVNAPGGTGPRARMNDLLVAGKTGTAQAAPFRTVLMDDQTHRPILDENGRKQYETYELSKLDHPNPKVPWYRGSGPNDEQIDHAWMIGFAPADHPTIAFAVLVEYGGSGGGAAADVVKASLESCIQHGLLTPTSAATQPVALISSGSLDDDHHVD